MTTLTFHLARALGRGWGTGDEIVVTELDHHANVAPWRALERERGVTVRIRAAAHDETAGTLELDRPRAAHRPAARGSSPIGAASNALGTITDVAPRLPRWPATPARSASSTPCTTRRTTSSTSQAIGCDFLACSAYKFYGPHIGILYGRAALVEALDVAASSSPRPTSSPERLETGTQNHEGIVGAAAAVDFLASLVGAGAHAPRRASRAPSPRCTRRGDALLAAALGRRSPRSTA